MVIEAHDSRRGYCRMLGHEVSFDYCRQGVGRLPCRNIFNCWFEQFDVESFIRAHYTSEQIETILTPPTPKIVTLLEMIEQAKKNL
jgi:hypothetical protein